MTYVSELLPGPMSVQVVYFMISFIPRLSWPGEGKREPGNDCVHMRQNLRMYTIHGLLDCILLARVDNQEKKSVQCAICSI